MNVTKIVVDAVTNDGTPISLGANLIDFPDLTLDAVLRMILVSMREADKQVN